MKYSRMLWLAIIASVVVAGCTKSTETTTSDEDAIEALIQGDYANYFDATVAINDSGATDDTIQNKLKGGTKGFIVGWGRQITHVSSEFTISVNNDTANVVINRNLDGILHVLWAPDTPGTLSDSIKSFKDKTERYALFVREGDPDEPIRRGWRLKGLSNVEINTQNLPDSIVKVNITKMEITKLDDNDNEIETITITDPSSLQNRDSIPTFLPDEKVRVRVYVDKNEPSVFAFFHNSRPYRDSTRHQRRRIRMQYNADLGCFEVIYYTPNLAGIYHSAADIIESNSLLESDYPYVANAWTFVYRVSSE